MVLQNPNNGETQPSEPDLSSLKDGETFDSTETHRFSEEIDSACSTPYVSAPSSPGRAPTGYFFSAPASPMHFVLSSAPSSSHHHDSGMGTSLADNSVSGSFEFEFSSRFSSNISVGSGSMSSADELFLNGQIRPMKLSSHLQRPQILAPLLDLEVEEDEESKDDDAEFEKRVGSVMRGRDLRLRSRSLHRKTRSMSPLRNAPFRWNDDVSVEHEVISERILELQDQKQGETVSLSTETTPSGSASSSRSSSSGRNSKKWIFLKDLLYRSKSEGRANAKEKFWSSISFSPAKEKKLTSTSLSSSSSKEEKTNPSSTETQKQKRNKQSIKKVSSGKPANGVSKRRTPPSAHELHYTANRAQAEEMKKKTFLPYRQGLLGCLGFSSKGYGALNGLTRTLNPVSSR